MVMLSNVICVAHTIHSVFDKNMLHKVFFAFKTAYVTHENYNFCKEETDESNRYGYKCLSLHSFSVLVFNAFLIKY